jgi:FG-GAP-like repeat
MLSMFLNQDGLLFTAADLPLDRQPSDVAAADLNRDSKVDLVVAATGSGDGVPQFSEGFAYVLLGRGDGSFAEPVQYEVAPGSWQIAVGDFTGDGILDIATANNSASLPQPDGTVSTSDTVSILAGKNDGTFGTAASLQLGAQNTLSPNRGSVQSLSAANLNGDKTPDLAVSGGAILLSRPANAKTKRAVTTQ